MKHSNQAFSRRDRVEKALLREVSDIVKNEVKDPRLDDTVISVTQVRLSNDLKYAKVFVSIFAEDEVQNELMTILLESTSRIRKEVGKRVRLRNTPEIELLLDQSLEHGMRINSLLDQISKGEL